MSKIRKVVNTDDEWGSTWIEDQLDTWNNCIGKTKAAAQISVTVNVLVYHRLAEILLELVKGNAKVCDTFRPDWEWHEIIEMFFLKAWPYTDRDTCFRKIRNKAIEIVSNVLFFVLDQYLPGLKVKTERRFPYNWMTSNKKILRSLNKKGNRHFIGLYKILMEERMGPAKDGGSVLVKPNYDLIEKRIGLESRYVRRYLREMCHAGILKKQHKDGKCGQMVYEIGKWVQGRSRFPKPVYFLKNTPSMMNTLNTFNAGRGDE